MKALSGSVTAQPATLRCFPVSINRSALLSNLSSKSGWLLHPYFVPPPCTTEMLRRIDPSSSRRRHHPRTCYPSGSVRLFCGYWRGIPSRFHRLHFGIRISHPSDRFRTGQDIYAVVTDVDQNLRVSLSHKELLGTWEETRTVFFR